MPGLPSKASNIEIKYNKIFINNNWQKAVNKKTFSFINTSTGKEISGV